VIICEQGFLTNYGRCKFACQGEDGMKAWYRGGERWTIYILFVLILQYTGPMRVWGGEAEEYLDSGNARYARGDYDGAIADYDRAIQLEPDSYVAYVTRGIAKRAKADYDGALADYNKAIQLKPGFYTAYVTRGAVKRAMEDYDGSIADYDMAIQLKPDHAKAHYARGYTYEQMGKFGNAIADYDKSIELEPDYAQAHYARGYAHEQMREFENAIEDYRRALAISQDSSKDRENLDSLLRILNGSPEFIKDIQRMLHTIGYYRGGADGVFGKDTGNALMAFQRDAGLTPIREINDETHLLLTRSYRDATRQTSTTSLDEGKFQINLPQKDGYETQQSSVRLDAVFKGSMELESIVVKINDQKVDDMPEPDYNLRRTSANIDYTFPLTKSINIITLVAFTKEGDVVKEKTTVIRRPRRRRGGRTGKKWAVVIGIEDYEDERVQDLGFSVDDAEEFAQKLIEKGKFPRSQVILLTDKSEGKFAGIQAERPTHDNIRKALFTRLREEAFMQDSVIVYYSGHGLLVPDPISPSGKTAYLLPVDFQYDAPEAKGIRLEEIKRLAYLAPERMSLIIDSCYIGGKGRGVKSVSESVIKPSGNEITKGFAGKGRTLLTSCRDDQVSRESVEFENGVFTHYLLDALEQKELMREIYRDVYPKVHEYTNGTQEPNLDVGDQQGEILLY
jgi:tetratricopeptide (TPR) repeat protein